MEICGLAAQVGYRKTCRTSKVCKMRTEDTEQAGKTSGESKITPQKKQKRCPKEAEQHCTVSKEDAWQNLSKTWSQKCAELHQEHMQSPPFFGERVRTTKGKRGKKDGEEMSPF